MLKVALRAGGNMYQERIKMHLVQNFDENVVNADQNRLVLAASIFEDGELVKTWWRSNWKCGFRYQSCQRRPEKYARGRRD